MLLDHLLPGMCLLCDRILTPGLATPPNAQLCAHCHAALPWNLNPCPACAVPLEEGEPTCAECADAAPCFERAIAPLRFEEAAQSWVHRLKFKQGMVEGRALAALLTAYIQRGYERTDLPDVVVPVHLSRRRLMGRGHNQALTLALWVARGLRLPVRRTALKRLDHTPPQTTQSREERQHNLVGAFQSKPWPGSRVALVDDVMTTTATVSEATNTLLAAGAAAVHVWVAARTPAP